MGQTERILSVDSKNAISEALNQSISELVVTTMMAQKFSLECYRNGFWTSP